MKNLKRNRWDFKNGEKKKKVPRKPIYIAEHNASYKSY